jgi:pimeloyl-ACP methyl ester carboxylesterase
MMEQRLHLDIRGSLMRSYYTLSGEAGLEERFSPVFEPGLLPNSSPAKCPSWLTQEDIDFFEAEFRRTGFTGPLNYYRNMDRNWNMTPFLDGAKIIQSTLFIAGDKDPVMDFLSSEFEALEANIPNLTKKVVLKGVGHWTQQEDPAEVNRLLIEFLAQTYN